MVEAIIGNLNHLSKFESNTIPVHVIKKSPLKPSNRKRSSWPFEKQDIPDKKNYTPVQDGSRLFLLIISGKVLGNLPDTTTVSNNLRSKICAANPKRFVDWYG